MPRVLTPLVVTCACAVVAFGALRVALLPGAWPSSLAGMLFLPVVILLLERLRRRRADKGRGLRRLRQWRAALVGAGVLLAAAFLLSATDALGLTDSQGSGRSAAVLLASVIAVCSELLSNRLENAERRVD